MSLLGLAPIPYKSKVLTGDLFSEPWSKWIVKLFDRVVRMQTEILLLDVSRDESTALTTGTGKYSFRIPYAFQISEVRACVTTAPTGDTLDIDVNDDGTSIFSTILTIDAGEKTTETATTAAVISAGVIAKDSEITVDIDQIGSGTAGAGLKVLILGARV